MSSQKDKKQTNNPAVAEYLLSEPLLGNGSRHYLNTMPSKVSPCLCDIDRITNESGQSGNKDQKGHPQYDGGEYYDEEDDPLDGGEAQEDGFEYQDDDQYAPEEDEEDD